MNTLHEDTLWKISYNPDLQYIKTEWTGKAMSDRDFNEKTALIIQFLEQCKPKFFLANASHFNYTISPDKQEWHNAQLFPIFKRVGLQKIAIIVPHDFFTQLSIQQAYANDEYGFDTQYFEDETEAIRWLESTALAS